MNTPLSLTKRLRIVFSQPSSYGTLYHQSIIRTLLAFFLFATLCGLLYGIGSYFLIQKIIPSTEQLSLFSEDVHSLYPTDLVMNVEGGTLSINQKSPYTIALPPRWKQFFESENDPMSLLTIDTNAAVEDYYRYNSLLMMTSDTFVYPRKDYEISFLRYEDLLKKGNIDTTSLMINHDTFEMFTKEFLDPLLQKIPFYMNKVAIGALVLATLLFGISSLAFTFFFLLFITIVLWMVSRFILKRPFAYSQLYFLGFSGILPILLLQSVFVLMGFWIISPLVFCGLYLAWMIFVLSKVKTLE